MATHGMCQYYTTPELVERWKEDIKQVVRDAMGVAVTYQTVVERASQVVATLDVLCALAYTAAFSPHGYCKPTLTDGEENGLGIDLKAARHPCVELQEDVEFIPNDFSLKFGESNFLVVTGPNMGGKSTVSCFCFISCQQEIQPHTHKRVHSISDLLEPLFAWPKLEVMSHVSLPQSIFAMPFWPGLELVICKSEA